MVASGLNFPGFKFCRFSTAQAYSQVYTQPGQPLLLPSLHLQSVGTVPELKL